MYNKHIRFNKKEKRPGFIYTGDICFFKEPVHCYPADKDWTFDQNIQRAMWPGEFIQYVKRKRGKNGSWLHCIESCGMLYVYDGSIKNLTKDRVPYREGWNHEEN